jgi:hypothetical protein
MSYSVKEIKDSIAFCGKEKTNPFEKCPFYENDNLKFTKVKEDDAEELFKCYSDSITLRHMNNDNCGGDWDVSTIEVVRKGIRGWESEFDAKFYIRWSVTHKPTNRIIGTIEIAPIPNTTRFFDGICKTGILRIDIISCFEKVEVFSEILKVIKENFYKDFDIKNIVTKSLGEDSERILALESNNFEKCENKDIIGYDDYYISVKE